MMSPRTHRVRPPRQPVIVLLVIVCLVGHAYLAWSPGTRILDGRHDLKSNGIWIQHGWLGDDAWFLRHQKDTTRFRNDSALQALAGLLAQHGIVHVYPHLCPCDPDGTIARVDPAQAERFLDHFDGFSVVPWIGGILNKHCWPRHSEWRSSFVASIVRLLQEHPRFAGVHINIEPMPSGNADFLTLLDEIRHALPEGKLLSVAAYPPPTRWHPFKEVHWDEPFFRAVAGHVDQLAVMMYDTGLRVPKVYQQLMSTWTTQILAWSGTTDVLLGVPAYDDAGVGYHTPRVENLPTAIKGIHAALNRLSRLPPHYKGIAIYCAWEIDDDEWSFLSREFERK